MKKMTILVVFTLVAISTFAQSNSIENFNMDRKVAVKSNPAKYLIGDFDIGIEYFLNQKRSVEFNINIANQPGIIADLNGNAYNGLFYGGLLRYKMWYRPKNDNTDRRLFNGLYMAPALAFGTSQREASPETVVGAMDSETLQEYFQSQDTNKFVGLVYDFGMSFQIKRVFLETYLGTGYIYNSEFTEFTSAGALVLNQSLIARFGVRMGVTF